MNEVHSLSVRLYEELTGLDILDATVRNDPKTGDERRYKCIQTTCGRSESPLFPDMECLTERG